MGIGLLRACQGSIAKLTTMGGPAVFAPHTNSFLDQGDSAMLYSFPTSAGLLLYLSHSVGLISGRRWVGYSDIVRKSPRYHPSYLMDGFKDKVVSAVVTGCLCSGFSAIGYEYSLGLEQSNLRIINDLSYIKQRWAIASVNQDIDFDTAPVCALGYVLWVGFSHSLVLRQLHVPQTAIVVCRTDVKI